MLKKHSTFKFIIICCSFFLNHTLIQGINIRVQPIQTNIKMSPAIKKKIRKLISFRMQIALEKKIPQIKLKAHLKNKIGNYTIGLKITRGKNKIRIKGKLLNNYEVEIMKVELYIKNISFIYDAIDRIVREISENNFPLQLRKKNIDIKILIDASAKMNLVFEDTKLSLLRFLKQANILNKKDKIDIELLFFRNNKLLPRLNDDYTTIKQIRATGLQTTELNKIINQIKKLSWQKKSSRFLIIYTNNPIKEINSFLLKNLAEMDIKIIAIPADNPTMRTISSLNRATIVTKGIISPPVYAVNYATGKETSGGFILNEKGELYNLKRPFYLENFFYLPSYIKNYKRRFRAQNILEGLEVIKRNKKGSSLYINNIQSNLAELIWQTIGKKTNIKLKDRITPDGKIYVRTGKRKLSFLINDFQKYKQLQKKVGKTIYLGIFLNPTSKGKLVLKREPLIVKDPPLLIRTTYQRILNNPSFYRSRGILTPNCWFIPVKVISLKN